MPESYAVYSFFNIGDKAPPHTPQNYTQNDERVYVYTTPGKESIVSSEFQSGPYSKNISTYPFDLKFILGSSQTISCMLLLDYFCCF